MEIKINKEIREVNERVFFGLTLRQCICCGLAIAVSVFLYFGLKDKVGRELLSYICVGAATPFAAAGFVRYNGMTLEKLVVIVGRYLITPKKLVVSPTTLYYEASRKTIEGRKRVSWINWKGQKVEETTYEDGEKITVTSERIV